MKKCFCLTLFCSVSLLCLTGCQSSGSYSDDRAGYPYSGVNKKKMSYAEKKYLRPR